MYVMNYTHSNTQDNKMSLLEGHMLFSSIIVVFVWGVFLSHCSNDQGFSFVHFAQIKTSNVDH